MKKKGNLVTDVPIEIVIAFLIVAAVLILIFRADILKYFQFIPDYGGNEEDKNVDADTEIDIPVLPETPKPFLVEIVDEKGRIIQSITFLDNIYLSIDKGERKCVSYKITPLTEGDINTGRAGFVAKQSQSEIKTADINSEKEIVRFKYVFGKINPLIESYYLKVEIICLDSSGKPIGKGDSQQIIIFTPKVIDLGFYVKGLGESFVSIGKPIKSEKEIYLVVNHAGCENNLQTDLFRRTAWWKILSGDEKIEGISIEKKDRNFVSYVIKNLQPGEYYAISTCEDNQGKLINQEQTKIDLEII